MFYEFHTVALIHCATVKHSQAGGKYSVEGLRVQVSGGEASKRFVRKPVNNLTSQGVKGHGCRVRRESVKSPWSPRTSILGSDASTCNYSQWGLAHPQVFFVLFYFIFSSVSLD